MKFVSLKSKILFSMVLTCSLIVLAISGFNLFQYSELERANIKREFDNFEQGAKQAIREAVWRYDWDMVETLLENQTSHVISFVEVCDKKVSRCLQHGNRGRLPFLDFQTPILYEERETGAQVEIGSIYLQSHYEPFKSHVINQLPRLLITNILGVFGIALILYYLFHRQVVQRLLTLEQYTRKIDLQNIEDLQFPTGIGNKESGDEIDLLADAVRHLMEKTNNEFERRQNLEQQLNQAHKMEALGNLAGGIAHDFNNMLAAIMGFAELSYLKSEPDSEVSKNLKKIINASERARNLASQILLFSRRTESPQQILILANVVEEALNIIRASLPSSIKIETSLTTGIRIKGDSTRLHQVIMNLATNAAQAIGSKGGKITITLDSVMLDERLAETSGLQPGCYCSLEICDDGPGIPDEIQARVFEPFFTTKKVGKGTGMGLAVVHGIVQNHGGMINMNSQLGTGTCFTIYLPQTEECVIDVDVPSTIQKGNGQQIILVDDEVQVLDMGCSILENLGYTVRAFSLPNEALAFLQKETSVDLVITDLTMPELNGVELAAAIKDIAPDLPIMLWTGYKDDIAAESIKQNLINSILAKPFIIEDLANSVSDLLKERRGNV